LPSIPCQEAERGSCVRPRNQAIAPLTSFADYTSDES